MAHTPPGTGKDGLAIKKGLAESCVSCKEGNPVDETAFPAKCFLPASPDEHDSEGPGAQGPSPGPGLAPGSGMPLALLGNRTQALHYLTQTFPHQAAVPPLKSSMVPPNKAPSMGSSHLVLDQFLTL